jgi:hypothetical protein
MTSFQGVRMWLRRAPLGERIAGIAAALIAVAALSWLLVPPSSDSATSVAAVNGNVGDQPVAVANQPSAGETPGTVGTGPAATPGASQPTGGTVPAATGGAVGQSTGGAKGCVSPPGSSPGVTATQIKVAVTVINVVGPAGNQALGVKTPAQQQSDFQAIFDAVNAAGGVACRKLLPVYYTVNPVDQSNQQQVCLDAVQAGVFAVLDSGANGVVGLQCFVQHHIPFLSSNMVTVKQANQFYPYLFEMWTSFDGLYKNTVFALKDRGFFSASNGFAKLGFVYSSCQPEVIASMKGWLHQAGVSDSQLVTYDIGCPATSVASPSDLQQAVLKFQSSGVTNVTTAFFPGNFGTFTTIAQKQGFKPKYGIGDDGSVANSYGSQRPDFDNIAGAIAISTGRFGEERTPGFTPSPGTAACNAIFAARGQPSLYAQGIVGGALNGAQCNRVWALKAAIEHSPTLARESLAAGLQRVRSVEFSYPHGPNDFSGNRVTWGGQQWRPLQFMSACSCWQLLDRNFHPSYS